MRPHRARRGRRRAALRALVPGRPRRHELMSTEPTRRSRCPSSSTSRGAQEAAAAPGRPRAGRAPGAGWTSSACRRSGPSSSRPTTSPGWSTTPPQMTDLPAGQREELVAALLPELMTPLRTLEADRGTTRKTLWRLFDGALVESVLMRYPDRVTMCVSSQAGCGMACPFCATGQGGLQRNMSTAEIVEQVRRRRPRARARRGPRRAGPGLQRRVHGHGRADGQLQGRDRRRTPAHRPRPRRARHVGARRHRVHRRAGPADAAARRRGHPGHARAQPARARRRAAQRAGADQHPLLRRRDRRGGLGATPTRPSAGSRSSTP